MITDFKRDQKKRNRRIVAEWTQRSKSGSRTKLVESLSHKHGVTARQIYKIIKANADAQ